MTMREPLTRVPLVELARLLDVAESLALDGPSALVAPFNGTENASPDPGAAHQARLFAIALGAEIRRLLGDFVDRVAHQAGDAQGPKRIEAGSWGMAERVSDKGVTGWRHDEVIDYLVPLMRDRLVIPADRVRAMFDAIPASYTWRRSELAALGLDADEVADVKDRGRTIKLTVTNLDEVRVLAEQLRREATGG